jgi:hypothetical protein
MMIEASLLEPGEVCLWSGKPNAIWFAVRRGWKPLLMAIIFLAASVGFFLQTSRLPESAGPQMPEIRIIARTFHELAAIAGVCGLVAFLWLWFRASRTIYTLTNRRVVIDTVGPAPRRSSTPLEHVRFIEVRSGLFGPSDLIFDETRRMSFDGWGLRSEGFIAIPDAARVEKLVTAAIEQTFASRTRGPWQ